MKKALFQHREKDDLQLEIRVDTEGEIVSDRKGFVDLGRQRYRKSQKVTPAVISRDFVRVDDE